MRRPLGELLAAALPRDEEFDAFVPVPLHWRRRWKRGFNQAALLADDLARRCGVPVIGALRRVRYTGSQTGLSNTSRRRNVAAAFAIRSKKQVAGKRLLLIDDVMTTGSTAASCASVLHRAGAARVVLLTVARADRRWNPVSLQAVETRSEETVGNAK